MPTPPSSQDADKAPIAQTKKVSARQKNQKQVNPKKTNVGRREKGSTGSLSATNPNGRRPGNTGSLSAKKVKRVRSGNTGTLSAKNPNPHVKASKMKPISGGKHSGGKHSSGKGPSRIPVALIAVICVVAVGVLAVGGFFVAKSFMHPYEGKQVEDGQTVIVEIPDGCDGTTIIQKLLDAGVIHSSKDFRQATAQQNADQKLRSGTYTFVTGSDPNEVVKQLVAGPNTTEGKLQVPEGLTIMQLATLVEQTLNIPSTEFLAQAKASNYQTEFAFLKEVANDSLEGYLYPKTYDMGVNVTPDDIIRSMLSQFETEYAKFDSATARTNLLNRYGLNVTDYDIIKIASIIEKEARNEDDRPKVSSVFYNRLAQNMALQSDATISYETGASFAETDLKLDSPYNTYLYKGLPPTPICSPSEWAIEAAMNPSNDDYLFFFIIEDGTYSNHTFTKTFEEHDAAYAAALQEQASGASNTGTPTATATDGTATTTTGNVAETTTTNATETTTVADATGGQTTTTTTTTTTTADATGGTVSTDV